jgi:hypothetical protein
MTRKYVVTLEDTLKGWQEDEDELERKYGAEPLNCGNCEIVQASINTGIRTASRLVDDVLDKIRAEIWDLQYGPEEKSMTNEDKADAYNNAIRQTIEIVDKYKVES